jgi:hypothetical protein
VFIVSFWEHNIVLWGPGLTQSVQCLTTGWTTGRTRFRSPAEAKDFSPSLCFQNNSEAHPAPYPLGTGVSFPGGKTRPGFDADHSPTSNAELKNESGYISSLFGAYMAVAGQLYFCFLHSIAETGSVCVLRSKGGEYPPLLVVCRRQ